MNENSMLRKNEKEANAILEGRFDESCVSERMLIVRSTMCAFFETSPDKMKLSMIFS